MSPPNTNNIYCFRILTSWKKNLSFVGRFFLVLFSLALVGEILGKRYGMLVKEKE